MLGMKLKFFWLFWTIGKKLQTKISHQSNLALIPHNKNEGVPIFLVEMDNFDLVEGDDVHDPTTTIQG
jgi:hypothetical protein